MSTAQALDRTHSCAFTFANANHCRMPVCPAHPYLCTFHARKEAAARGAERAGQQIAYDLSSRYVSFSDLSSAIAHTISAVAQRHMTPRAATSIAYLSQTLYQSTSRAETDYVRTFGVDAWKRTMAHNLSAAAFDDGDEVDDQQESPNATTQEANHGHQPAQDTDESAEEENDVNLANKT
jgi:hypothetical protein